jgi:hypothetical protein
MIRSILSGKNCAGVTTFTNRIAIYRVRRGMSPSSPYFAPLSNQIINTFPQAEFYFLCSNNNLNGARSDSDFLWLNNCVYLTRRVVFDD